MNFTEGLLLRVIKLRFLCVSYFDVFCLQQKLIVVKIILLVCWTYGLRTVQCLVVYTAKSCYFALCIYSTSQFEVMLRVGIYIWNISSPNIFGGISLLKFFLITFLNTYETNLDFF